jgi:hypothetical protein
VPTISRFFGIVITINYGDHPPPHFHARYAEHKAVLSIDSLALLEGSLPPRVLGMVIEWAKLHQAELAADWALAAEQQPLLPIAPLE